jgi:hypothetical protein
LPSCVIGKATVWQCSLCPAAEKIANISIFGA